MRYRADVDWTPAEVRKRREARRWSRRQLGDAVGASERAIAGYELGQVKKPGWLSALDEVFSDDPNPVKYAGPPLRQASNEELVAEVARRISIADTTREGSSGYLGIEGGVPPGVLDDPGLIDVDSDTGRNDFDTAKRRQSHRRA